MAKLYFRVQADYDQVIRLRNEIAKLETQIKSMDVNKAPQAVAVLNNQMQQAKQQMRGMVEEAAKAGAVMGNDFKNKVYQGSQAVNDFTQRIINQKTVVKDIESDVRNLSDAYKKVRNNPLQANSALGELNAAKKALQEEKSTLFGLQTEQSNARLSVKKLKDEYALYTTEVKNSTSSTFSFGKALGIIGGVAALKQLGSQIINVRSQFRSAEVSLDTMVGEDQAKKLLSKTKAYAKISPLEFMDIQSSTEMMIGFNIEAEKVPRYIEAIGDISRGESQKFQSLSLAFSQMSAAGKLMGQDLNQMINAGFNPLQFIAEKTGKTIAQLKDEMSKGAISAEMVQQAFIDATSAGGKFYGMSQKQSQEVAGQMSILSDTINNKLNEIGESNEGLIKTGIKGAISLVENYEEIGKAITILITTYGTYKTAIILSTLLEEGGSKALWGKIAATKAATIAQATYNKVLLMNPYVVVAAGIVAIGVALYTFSDHVSDAEKKTRYYNNSLDSLQSSVDSYKDKANGLLSIIQDDTKSRYEQIKSLHELQKMMPTHLKNITLEAAKIMSVGDSVKYFNEQAERNRIIGAKTDVVLAQRELEMANKLASSSSAGMYSGGTSVLATKRVNDAKIKLQAANDVLKEVLKMQSEVKKSEKTTTTYKQDLDKSKKDWDDAKKELTKIEKDKDSFTSKQYDEAKKRVETSEKAYKDLGGKTGSSLSKEESTKEKLRKETDKYNVLLSKQALEEQRTAEDLQMKTDEARIKSLDDGSKKTIEQMEFNFEKEMQAIDRQKEDLLRKKIDNSRASFEYNPQNKGKSFDASGISLSDAEIKDFNEQYKAAIAEYGKEVDKQNATGIQVMNDYLKEYGTFQQKKLAIAQEYDEKIAKSTDEWQKKSLEEQKTSAIGKVDIESIKADIDWVSVFSEFGGMFKSITEPILEKAKEYTKTKEFKQSGASDQKTLVDAINKMEESMGVGGSLNFKKLGTDMAAYQLAVNSLKKAKIEEYESIERLKKAQEDYNKALKDGSDQEKKTTKDTLDLAQQNADASSTNVKSQEEAANSAQQAVTNTASNLQKSMSSVVEGLSQLSSGGLNDAYQGLIKMGNGMGGAMGDIANKLKNAPVVGWIASIIDVLKDGLSDFFGSILDSIGDAIVNGTKDLFSGDVFKTIVKSVTSSSSEMINLMSLGLNDKILGFLGVGGNAKEVNELVDKLTNSNKYLINAIDKLTTEMEKSGGESATELYTDAYQKKIQKIENDRQMLEAKMGYHGAHHSNDYYINDAFNAEDWEKASDYVGKKLSSAGDLWKLSSEDLSKLQELPDIWENINSGKYDQSEWLDAYIDDAEALQELTEQWQETMAQTSFDDFYSSFLDTLSDMSSDAEDFADDFESYLQKSILNAMLADNFKSRIQALYDSWTDAYKDDNKITPDEAEELKKQQQDITDDMIAQRQSLIDAFGWDTSSSSSQGSTSGGYETISQDTGEEVSGRLTAVQITGEELKAQSVLQSQSLNMLTVKAEELLTVSKDSKDIADETRTILANSYLELQEIRENTGATVKELKNVNERLGKIESNTKGLVSR